MSDLTDRITVNPEQCGGGPCIRGMRISVVDILDLFAAGLSASEILEEMPDLEEDDLKAALKYAALQLNGFGRRDQTDPHIQIEPQSNGASFLSKLKAISIEGPEDFAANIDQYLSGEKSIG